jgi:hypothetical protein
MGMELNHWQHTRTGAVAGVNKHFGSPRGWINRAYDAKFAHDSASVQSTSTLDPREVTAAAIFHRPCKLPDLGNQRVLYRFFYVPSYYAGSASDHRKRNSGDIEYLSVIGLCVALPARSLLKWKDQMTQAGAEWVWVDMPQEMPKAKNATRQKVNISYNYEEIYSMLEKGMTVTEIANSVGGNQPAISYIKKRWVAGLPPKQQKNQRSGPLDHEEIISDRNSGLTLQQVADKHNTTKQTVFSIMHKYG